MDIKISRSKRYLPLEDFGAMLELADISLDVVLERVLQKEHESVAELSMIDEKIKEYNSHLVVLAQSFEEAAARQKKINGLMRVFDFESKISVKE